MSKGGGGSSGKMDWPSYMTAQHSIWLNELDVIIPSANPYTGALAYNPDSYISAIETQVTNLVAFYDSIGTTLLSTKTSWETLATTVQTKLDSLLLLASTSNAFTTIEADLRRFKGRMRDINAVQTSSFVLGNAALYTKEGFELIKLADSMRSKEIVGRNAEIIEGSFQLFDQSKKLVTDRLSLFNIYMDKCRIDVIAKKEQLDRQTELDLEEVRWKFFEFQEAGNLLGSIKGGQGTAGILSDQVAKPNVAMSVVGGAVQGAMIGSYFGPYGTVIGAIVGGIGGYFMAQ